MTFKEWSAAQGAPAKANPDDKASPAADQPATQPDKKPAEAPPAPKP